MKKVQMFEKGYFNYPAEFKDVLDKTFSKEIKIPDVDFEGIFYSSCFKAVKIIIYSIDENKLKKTVSYIGKGFYSREQGQPVTIPIYIREYLGINDNKRHNIEIEIKHLDNPF